MRQLRYSPAAGAGFGVEALSFGRLRRMDPGRRRVRPQRPDFHVLGLVRSGSGRHTADFVDEDLRARSVVWIRPGVVHRWTDVEDLDGPLILFEQGFLPAGPAARAAGDAFAPATRHLDAGAWDLAVRAADHLAREHAAAVTDPRLASPPVLAHLLAALVLRVVPAGQAGAAAAGEGGTVFHRYRAAVEEHFTRWHHVGDYARALGYGTRTLTRATRVGAGVGAKRFLDQRILLEAKRLLAHTDLPVARCAERLGFDDPANFTAFFQRQEGLSPGRWRTARSGR
ncbi:AraC family transcriptional regulator [Actinoallomurus spadix]|uniref:AraC family transcriptional regulator n=1 Tax=Actinoallomurus spadix TaxID=79912 RepID=A0ABP3GHD3_9ACTN|nr:AraC family transcriptional regulator [Actinoallomurus spadix]MCO5990130.1 AraC family transcriptional regulator [Actinoallomurus spadix]